MRLFIAEKPELARAIVEGLGGGSKKGGYYDCGEARVTWCFGHMLQLLEPSEYDSKYEKWNLSDLPFSFIPWRKKPNPKSKEQLEAILALLKEAKEVVNAGDPDAEGQLLIDEVIDYAKYKGVIKRVLINDNNVSSVKKALDSLRDNKDFEGLSQAAEARQVADQLYGFNLTRLYTIAGRQKGLQEVLSVGRVQTPILGLVVRRDRENAAHKKAYYYTIKGSFAIGGLDFSANYKVKSGDTVDDKNRLIDENQAKSIAANASGKEARIVSAKTEIKRTPPPLPFNLLKLQTTAAKLYKMKPDKVKDITQDLREKHKLITYNRSDCQYLPEEHHNDAAAVLAAIAKTDPSFGETAKTADPKLKSRAFDDSKISAHHAIVPTQATADFSQLSDGEQKIYHLIARAYIAQFFPSYEYEHTALEIAVSDYLFSCQSATPLAQGWKLLYGKEDADDESEKKDESDDGENAISLKSLSENQTGDCKKAEAVKNETKPRPLYTMATLLNDLTKVADYVKDERLRKVLIEKDKGKAGERGGIGTPATRDTIIKTLFDRGFLIEKGKNVVSSDSGQRFYDALPDNAKYPDMTALWHEQQQEIEAKKLDIKSFIGEIVKYIDSEVKNVSDRGLNIDTNNLPKCPVCQKPLIRRKGQNGYFWGCSGYPDCKTTLPDENGKPGKRTEQKEAAQSEHKCGECGKPLVRRPSSKKQGSFWWGCSGYPNCKKTYFDKGGKPDYEGKK